MAKVQAQQARRILDRLVGYKVSPYLWKTVRYGLSAGRAERGTPAHLRAREQIRAFTPQEYWTIDVDLETPAGELFRARVQKKEKLVLTNEAGSRAEAAELEKERFAVASLGRRRRSEIRARRSSRARCNKIRSAVIDSRRRRRWSWRSSSTRIDLGAEGSTGLITYMRTDSTRVSPDAIAEVRNYIQHTRRLLSSGGGAPPPLARDLAGRARGGRPTAVSRTPASLRSHLEPDQFKLYELVWQRFVSSQMNPALVLTTTAEITAGACLLRASGSRIKFDGFARAYATALIEDAEEGKSKLPALAQGDALASHGVLPEQHFTEPPPHYTEATLVKTLEEKGIGRPSTYATIVGTILTRDYVTRDRGKLVPTDLGMTVWKILAKAFSDVFDVAFTARLEGRLDHVEMGKDPGSTW